MKIAEEYAKENQEQRELNYNQAKTDTRAVIRWLLTLFVFSSA